MDIYLYISIYTKKNNTDEDLIQLDSPISTRTTKRICIINDNRTYK